MVYRSVGQINQRNSQMMPSPKTVSVETNMSIASFLREKREQRGLTQKALADQTGISNSAIKQYERESGGSMPTIEKAARIAQVLEFDPAELFDEALRESGGAAPTIPRQAPNLRTIPKPNTEQRVISSDLHPVVVVIEKIEALQILLENRGITAREIPRLLTNISHDLAHLNYEDLLFVSEQTGSNAPPIPNDLDLSKISHQARDEICNNIESHILAYLLYGDAFFSLVLDDLRKLHRVTAHALNRDFPLPGVPARYLLGDVFSDEDDNRKLRDNILAALPKHLVDAAIKGQPVIFRFLDADFKRADEGGFLSEEPEKFEVARKLT